LLVEGVAALRGRALLHLAGERVHLREHFPPSLAARLLAGHGGAQERRKDGINIVAIHQCRSALS